jgi:hypothetical protein
MSIRAFIDTKKYLPNSTGGLVGVVTLLKS